MPDQEIETVEIGGKQYTVSKQFKEALEQREQELKNSRENNSGAGQGSGQGNGNDQGNGQGNAGGNDQGYYVPDYVKDPDQFKQTITEEVKQRIRDEEKQRKEQENREKELWDQFYKDRPHLKKFDFLVKAVAGRDWDDLKQYADEQDQTKFFEELGKRAEQEFINIKGEPNSQKETFVEGGPEPIGNQSGEEGNESDKPKTLGQIMNERQENREKARTQAA